MSLPPDSKYSVKPWSDPWWVELEWLWSILAGVLLGAALALASK